MECVFGLVGDGFTVIAADTSAVHSILVHKSDEDKIMILDSHKLLGVSGEAGDRAQFTEYIQKNVHLYQFRNGIPLTTAAAANFTRGELATALRKNPYFVNILLAGYDKDIGPSLYFIDYIATLHKIDKGAFGYGSYFALSLMDRHYHSEMSVLEAVDLVDKCIKEIRSSNRAAAFLQLVKLNKALADAETTITLNPQWEKGYFRKGCVLEVMERYDDSVAALQEALLYNPHSLEVSKKIKKLTQLAKDKKQTQEIESIRSNIDMKKYLEPLKSELVEKFGTTGNDEAFFFLVNVMESAIKAWHETSKLDPSVYFLLDNEKTQTDKYAPVVNVDKAFESPHTHSNCFSFLRQYAEESFSKAACLVVPKSIIAYPQVWKGQGSRKWKHGHSDGFFVQFESPVLRNLWFVPSLLEKGQTLCRDPEVLDIGLHEVFPRLFKEPTSHS